MIRQMEKVNKQEYIHGNRCKKKIELLSSIDTTDNVLLPWSYMATSCMHFAAIKVQITPDKLHDFAIPVSQGQWHQCGLYSKAGPTTRTQ